MPPLYTYHTQKYYQRSHLFHKPLPVIFHLGILLLTQLLCSHLVLSSGNSGDWTSGLQHRRVIYKWATDIALRWSSFLNDGKYFCPFGFPHNILNVTKPIMEQQGLPITLLSSLRLKVASGVRQISPCSRNLTQGTLVHDLSGSHPSFTA